MSIGEKKLETVLHIDDEAPNRYLVGRMLERAGFRVIQAGTAEEGIKLAGSEPDLILLDVNLPDMSGFEVCRRLKADPATSAVPVLHLSANFVRNEDHVQGLEAGADGYLVYPLDPSMLVATIRSLIRIRSAEAALRESESRFRKLYDSNMIGVLFVTLDGRITDANDYFLRMLGYGREDLGTGLRWDSITPPEYRHLDEAAVKQLRELGACDRFEKEYFHRDGSRVPVILTGAVPEGSPGEAVCYAVDIGGIKRTERDLAQAVQDREHLIAAVSHDLKNPLSAIDLTAQLLERLVTGLEGAGRGSALKQVAVLRRSSDRMKRLISELLDRARSTSGHLELDARPCELGSLISETVAILAPVAEAKGVQVAMDVDRDTIEVQADPERLMQVLSNLVGNAVKFTPEGGTVSIHARGAGSEIEVSVVDSGPGIPPDQQPFIFDRFWQAKDTAAQGTGLGLSICRDIVEAHRGRIWVESSPGQGATFAFALPVAGMARAAA